MNGNSSSSSSSSQRRLAPKTGPSPPEPPENTAKVSKSVKACERCRGMRKRCDGTQPCARCRRLQGQCEYTAVDGRKREDWRARIEALEQRNAYLEQVVQQMGGNRDEDGVGAVPMIQPDLGNGVERGSTSTSTNGPYQSSGTPQEQDLHNLFYTATAADPLLGSLEMDGGQDGHYRRNCRDRLPAEPITRRAVKAFFQCAATLFYVTTEKRSGELLDKVYRTNDASMQDIVEVAACAAIGSHYKSDEIPEEARVAFFYLASTSLHEALEADHIQGMRIFICLGMTCIMDKCSNARLLIITALNLARAKMKEALQNAPTEVESDECRRILQTLVFLEGWLSYSLGYRNCLNQNEIDLVRCTVTLNVHSQNSEAQKTRLIQSHMTRLAVLASGIQDEIAHYQHDDCWIHADKLSAKLDLWHAALPPDLHLAALNKQEKTLTLVQERSLCLVHILYIDARLQLYCRLFKASHHAAREKEQQMQNQDMKVEQAQEHEHEHEHEQEQASPSLEGLLQKAPRHISDVNTDFAVQLARIASLLYNEHAIFTRCWLVICSVFDTCVVLLLGICLKYITGGSPGSGNDNHSIPQLAAHLDSCLAVLRFCGRSDIAAHRLGAMVDPIVEQLNRMNMISHSPEIHEDRDQMKIQSVLGAKGSPSEAHALLRMTYRLLSSMPLDGSTVWV